MAQTNDPYDPSSHESWEDFQDGAIDADGTEVYDLEQSLKRLQALLAELKKQHAADSIRRERWGGSITIHGGVTARPRVQAIAGLTLAGRYKDFELSLTSLPTISGGSNWFIQHFDLMGAYYIRLWENKAILRPKIGVWNMWNGREKIKWNETDIVYGLAIDYKLYDNLYFTVQGLDVSSNGHKSTRSMNTRKLLTAGWTLKF